MKRPSHPAPAAKPVVKTRVGPNWKLLVHFCIIAGLIYAISIAWQNLGEAKTKREAENHLAVAKRAQAYEEAKAEARRQAAARDTRVLPTQPEISTHDVPAPVEAPQQTIDSPEISAAPVEEIDPGPEFAALTARARELVIAAERKRAEQLAENAKTLAWHLDVWLRSLPKTEQTDWLPHVTRIKSAASHGRVPASIPESSGILLSGKMTELTNAAVAKQSEINRGFLSETGKIHRAYLARIRDAISQAESSGQSATAVALGRASESAANLESWLQSLGVDFQSADDSPLTQ